MDNTYARLRALFEQCVEMPEGECERWMDRNVADTGLRIELKLMLAADRGEPGFFHRDVVDHIDLLGDAAGEEFNPESLIGRRFGAFQLQRLLGQGGQGTVYLGERVDSDFTQSAAVKLLRRGIHDRNEHRRFRREREILARFEHAGVARLIDGGVSGDGVPFLVMEYVDGVNIEQWCEKRALDPRARVVLIAQLCDIVSAAHRALIVHRDLKPSNVLVTPEGAVKVLDFGIARLLDEDESQTQTVGALMTPGYGAPEQARGGAITLATDVHALGMLLRVLLTGAPPPTRPDELQALPAFLPQELRWVIAKACATESEQRYRDAAELGDDLARYLGARPVLAHPPSRWYTTRKFVKRHRGGVLTTVAVLLGILASAGVALWQAKVARDQAQRAEAARDFLLGIFEAAKQDLPRDARPTPEVLVRAAVKKLDSDTRLEPALRAEFLGTLSAISYSSSDYAQAVEQADRALAVLQSNGLAQSRDAHAIAIKRANALVSLGRYDEAELTLSARMSAIRAVSDNTAVEGLASYSAVRFGQGEVDEAIAIALEASEVALRVHGKNTAGALVARANYGDLLAVAGQNQEAAVVLEAVIAQWRTSQIAMDHDLANSMQNLSTAKYHLGDLVGSERLLRESLALSRQIFTAPHEKIADALFSLGVPLMDASRNDEAEQVMLEAASMYTALFGPLHPQNAGMLEGLGSLELNRQNYAKAADYLERATRICTEAKLDDNPDCARFWQNLSFTYLKLERIDDAERANARGLAQRRTLFGEQHPAYAGSLAGQASVQLARSQPALALASIDQALAIFSAKGQSESLGGAAMRRTRATALNDLKRHDEALLVLDQSEVLLNRLEPGNAESQLATLAVRAEILSDSGRESEAREAARAALKHDRERALLSARRWQRLEDLAR